MLRLYMTSYCRNNGNLKVSSQNEGDLLCSKSRFNLAGSVLFCENSAQFALLRLFDHVMRRENH